jgi:hypothetical protein
LLDAPGVMGLGQPCHPFGGGGEQHAVAAAWQARIASPIARWDLCRVPIWGYVTTVRDEW